MIWRRSSQHATATKLVMALLFLKLFPLSQGFAPSTKTLQFRFDLLTSRQAIRRNKKGKGDVNGGANNEATSNVPGDQFFRNAGNSYVPSGISREEYQKLREGEIEKDMKMNYAAWGPRFKQTDRPAGDWMVMPNLWTAGRVNRPPGQRSANGDEIGDGDGPRWRRALRRVFQVLENNAVAFILAYVLLDCIEIGLLIWRWKVEHMNTRKAFIFIFRSILFQRKVIEMTVIKFEAIKAAVAVAVAPILNGRLEHLNRKYLWSKQRSSMTFFAAAMVLLTIWRGALNLVHFP